MLKVTGPNVPGASSSREDPTRREMLRLFTNISCVSKMLKCIYLASFVQICYGQAVTTINPSLHMELYSTQQISCNITGTLKTGVRWIRPDTLFVSSCVGATSCLPIAGYTNPVATTTRNVLEIANTTTLDAGLWTCKDGADGQPSSGNAFVTRNSSECIINSTSSLDSLKRGSQVTVMVYTKQYYCSPDPLFQLGDANVTLSRTPTGLDDNEGNVTISVTRTETLNLYLVCGGVRFKQSCDVTITVDYSSTTTEGTTGPPPQPGMCDNNDWCYLFFLLVLLFIPFFVLVWWCRKKKGDKKSERSDDKKMKELNSSK